MLGPLTYGALSQSTAAAFVGAYDAIPDLVHLYEPARRGVSSYEGRLCRIYRVSDAAEMDFSYDNDGNLDTAAIATFLGASAGLFAVVADQVGSDDVEQSTVLDMPLFVASGQNSKPVMRFDAANTFLTGSFSGSLSQPFTVYAAGKADDNDDNAVRALLETNSSSDRMILRKNNTGTPDGWEVYGGAVLAGGSSDTNWNIWAVLFNNTSSAWWMNGVSEATGTIGTANPGGITIGARFDGGGNFWDGDIAMVAIADPSHDDTERAAMQTAVNNFWSIF